MRMHIAAGCLLIASATTGAVETVYKYRGADGKALYSDQPILGAELIELFSYTPSEAVSPRPETSRSDAASELRIRTQISALDAAWVEVQESGKALADAEALLSAGVAPVEGDVRALAGPATPAPPSAGGPMAPATPPAGGPLASALPSAGGPMGARRGGGLRPEYRERLAKLEADVQVARTRNQEAWSRLNLLR